ncbi:MAG: beta-phosphoglucomutase [Gemmatales bacterium]|nr:MAG: beta-phosphoglucomutase [Gemmatales bacterium]
MNSATNHGLIWDVDGTLVDTGDLHYWAWKKLADELGFPFTRDDFTSTFGWRNPEIIRKLFGSRFGDAEIADLANRKEDFYKQAAREQGVTLLPGANSLLRAAKEAGWRQAIGSSAPRGNIDLILELTGSAGYFSAIVSQEDTERGKPDPQVFQIAAQRLQVEPACCIVFEDAPVGVQAAKSAGMKCIAVRFLDHHSQQALQAAGADLIVDSLESISFETIKAMVCEK